MLYENRITFEVFEAIQFTGKNIGEILDFLNTIIFRVNPIQGGGVRICTKSRLITIPQNGYVTRKLSVHRTIKVFTEQEFEQTFEKKEDSICNLLRR